MNSKLDTLDNLDPQALMRDIHAQLISTNGLLRALSLSKGERRAEFEEHGPDLMGPLDLGHAEELAGYLAEEAFLAQMLAEQLLDTPRHQADEPVDTTGLTLEETRRLSCLTSEPSRLNAGEGLGTLLSGMTAIARWFTSNAEQLDPLNPRVPALMTISHRLETIEALANGWVSVMMAKRSKPATT
ncbi:hypothetical protein [Halomonas ramblicola]|uniref:hypothetical protein n=1 Tax=Halomonas ramblicola TaxID=747349 RepID=UPI0025B290B6|nr:hypothetical protein [Halomonas ramblicola]MDN3521520.1 hypothetical protein [Halomonas ramblicola]